MNSLVIKLIAVGILAGLVYLGASKCIAQTRELAMLQTVMEQADATAKANELKHEEANNELRTKINSSNTALADYRRRLLRAQSAIKGDIPSVSPQTLDGASSEPSLGYYDIEFQVSCGADAIKVMQWQEWATRHGFPVED